MWRRFQSGSFGNLSARQYTEVQDRVGENGWRYRDRDLDVAYTGRPLVVKIGPRFGSSSGQGQSDVPGAQRVGGQAYHFQQVHMRLDNNGEIEIAERSYGLKSVIPGAFSDTAIYAVDLNPVSNLAIGSLAMIVPVDIDMGEMFNDLPYYHKAMYVIVNLVGQTQSKLLAITRLMDEQGHYMARERSPASGENVGEEVNLYNMYEREGNDWYGAMDPELQNPCAALQPQPLQVGHTVIATEYSGIWYMIAPTPFKVTCVDCGTNPGGALPSTYLQVTREAAAAGIMLNGEVA